MSEETIPFVGIVVPLVIAMGYDAITGLLVVYVASNIGFSSAFLNPFTVGIAQEMSGLPLFSGMGYRIFCWVLLTAVLVVFILFYSSRIRKTPQAEPCASSADTGQDVRRPALILLTLLVTVILLIVGVTCFKWYMAEISALFLAMGIVVGILGGFRANRIADEFVAGAKDIFPAALVVGLASGIIVILQDGHVVDSILHGLESGLGGARIARAYVRHPDRDQPAHSQRDCQGCGDHPHHGAFLRHDPSLPAGHGHGLPVRRRLHQHGHPDFGGAHGCPGHGEGPIR
jgi:uncharacterized ion transporter superfamily protein YfcC